MCVRRWRSCSGYFADTGGRPLGLAFDRAGNLIVADALRGLLSIAPDGKQTVLVAVGDDAPLSFPQRRRGGQGRHGVCDRFVAAVRCGAVGQHPGSGPARHHGAIRDGSGALHSIRLRRDVRVVASGLSLANGIALSDDEQSLLVSESGRYRVWRIDVSAQGVNLKLARERSAHPAGQFARLPGQPDARARWAYLAWPGRATQRERCSGRLPISPRTRVAFAAQAAASAGILRPCPGIQGGRHDRGRPARPIRPRARDTGLTETARRRYLQSVDDGAISWLANQPIQYTSRR